LPTKGLTELFVERVKSPAHGRAEYFDAAFRGLALRVTETGHKSWSLHYRIGGKQRRFTIGTYPHFVRPIHSDLKKLARTYDSFASERCERDRPKP